MTTPGPSSPSSPLASPNQRLLGAALAGLLCLAPAGCSSKPDSPGTSGAGGASGGASAGGDAVPGVAAGAVVGAGAGAGPGAGAGGDRGSGDAADVGGVAGAMGGAGNASGDNGVSAAGTNDSAGAGGNNAAGAGGAAPERAHITSSQAVGVLVAEDFKKLCDQRSGTVEVMPHCGGFATAKGFSYDNGTGMLSEHTCAGANTCGGWNCVVPD